MLIGEVIPQLYAYLAANPAAAERREFAHILVDEFQDLNRAEQGVLGLLSDNAEMCIVGDDDQSIYSFKHAHPEGIREWLQLHIGADDLTLAECRRCPTQVVAMANALITHNRTRPVQRVLTPINANGGGNVQILQYSSLDQEIAGVADLVNDLVTAGTRPGDILILAQRGVIGTPIYEALLARQVPVRSYYAEAELDREEAQGRFALLKLFADREDRVALRWLLGLGSNNWLAGNYHRLRNHVEGTVATPWECLEGSESGILRIRHTTTLVAQFRRIRHELEQLEAQVQSENLYSLVSSLFPEGNDSVRDLRMLALETLDAFGSIDRITFLRELTSAIAKPEIPTEVEDVRIMSLHKSKGLSSPVTIIAGCVEGLLPQRPDAGLSQAEQIAQMEEQRRLFFVGISRVKAVPAQGLAGTLLLTYSQQMSVAAAMGSGIAPARMAYGSARLIASRFIREMGRAAPKPSAR
jgi:superfamily I DNA/RNA helicase